MPKPESLAVLEVLNRTKEKKMKKSRLLEELEEVGLKETFNSS
jgi:hypothetical protein